MRRHGAIPNYGNSCNSARGSPDRRTTIENINPEVVRDQSALMKFVHSMAATAGDGAVLTLTIRERTAGGTAATQSTADF